MSSSRRWQLRRDDEELAKKDDDLALPKHARQPGTRWQPVHTPRRGLVLRLVAYLAVVALLLFVLIRMISSGGDDASSLSGLDRHRYPPSAPGIYDPPTQKRPPPPPLDPVPETNPKTKPKSPETTADQPKTYNGPIKFFELAASLRAISSTGGSSATNRNVLFAAASLESAATLLPMACRMAYEKRAYVHFAFAGRSSITLKELLQVNGIDKTCPMIMHDARPDHADTSTETRMAVSVARALYYVNTYMHPQAVLVDSTAAEETFFLRGARDELSSTQAALIELPHKPETRLSWITRLDAPALAAWNKVHFDILVRAPATGAGNIKRLLKSLARADLAGHVAPHLSVELPHVVENPLQDFLARYQWPPSAADEKPSPQMMSLHRRVPNHRINEEESSVRFLESFWPMDPLHHHVLVLSPNVEVTPNFFHFVKFAVLFYRHSRPGTSQDLDLRMMGLSFAIPTVSVDGTQPFVPPTVVRANKPGEEGAPFLWQSPASDAVLFMGDKWFELHQYVSHVLRRRDSSAATAGLLGKKEVGKHYPAWMEYAVQLARLRGYFTLFPGKEMAAAIVGVHTDLPEKPEEYDDAKVTSKQREKDRFVDRVSQAFDPGSSVDMLETLPKRGDLQPPEDLPIIRLDGKQQSFSTMLTDTAQFADKFRRQIGGCSEADLRKSPVPDVFVRDLFCDTKRAA
ncbi:glycosyltransferase 2 [Purpureocillium lavendulum]|uniref:Glycosyltransferase 2 n=1 Tax=Purpureocillium lavendulum TaxID=1247861 RepID=A0AB34G082_9HYPO|nr:glycosyltransferase 2 [Purpureocillium lavendulum]